MGDSADLAFAFLTTVAVVFVLCVTGYVVDTIEDWRASRARNADVDDRRRQQLEAVVVPPFTRTIS